MNSEFAISNLIVKHGVEHDLTIKKITYIMYFLQKVYWNKYNKYLIDSFFVKRNNAPFLSGIHYKYGENNNAKISVPITHYDQNLRFFSSRITSKTKENLLLSVLKILYQYSEDKLLELIHGERGWDDIREEEVLYCK